MSVSRFNSYLKLLHLLISVHVQSYGEEAIKQSLQQNLPLLENDLMIYDNLLIDELQEHEYCSEDEVIAMKTRTRKDQVHLLVEILEVLDVEKFLIFLEMLHRHSFAHIAEELKSSFDKAISSFQTKTTKSKCPKCRIEMEVDIKEVRCHLKSKNLLSNILYWDINACRSGKGHQGKIWKELFRYLKSFNNVLVEEQFVEFLNTPRHTGLYLSMISNFPTNFRCFCFLPQVTVYYMNVRHLGQMIPRPIDISALTGRPKPTGTSTHKTDTSAIDDQNFIHKCCIYIQMNNKEWQIISISSDKIETFLK